MAEPTWMKETIVEDMNTNSRTQLLLQMNTCCFGNELSKPFVALWLLYMKMTFLWSTGVLVRPPLHFPSYQICYGPHHFSLSFYPSLCFMLLCMCQSYILPVLKSSYLKITENKLSRYWNLYNCTAGVVCVCTQIHARVPFFWTSICS